ncbi:MAG: hypothetical protein AAF726_17925 [Planctomycetota bacterium]
MALLWKVTRLFLVALLVTSVARGQGVSTSGGVTVGVGAATSPDADVLDSTNYFPAAGGQLTVRYSGSSGSMSSYDPSGTLVQSQSAAASNGTYTTFSFTAFSHLGTGAWTVVYDPNGSNGGGGTATWTFGVGVAPDPCANDVVLTGVANGTSDAFTQSWGLDVGATGSFAPGTDVTASLQSSAAVIHEVTLTDVTDMAAFAAPGTFPSIQSIGQTPVGVSFSYACRGTTPPTTEALGTFSLEFDDPCQSTIELVSGAPATGAFPCNGAWVLEFVSTGSAVAGDWRYVLTRSGDPLWTQLRGPRPAEAGGVPAVQMLTVSWTDTYTVEVFAPCAAGGDVSVGMVSFDIDCDDGPGGDDPPGELTIIDCIPDNAQAFSTIVTVTIPEHDLPRYVNAASIVRTDAAGNQIASLYTFSRGPEGCDPDPNHHGVTPGTRNVSIDTGFNADTPEDTRYLALRVHWRTCNVSGGATSRLTGPFLVALCDSGGGGPGSGGGEGAWDQAEIDALIAAAEGTENALGMLSEDVQGVRDEIEGLRDDVTSPGMFETTAAEFEDGAGMSAALDGFAPDIPWVDAPARPYALTVPLPGGDTATVDLPFDPRLWDTADPVLSELDTWRQRIRDLLVIALLVAFTGHIIKVLRMY